MICAACGATNDADCRFCTECGGPLAPVCPQCSATSRPGSKFCGNCGAPLAAASPAPAAQPSVPPAPSTENSGAQRRVVTIVFADLVGFTTISQHRDAEEVRDLLTRYFDAARAAVERHGGVVEKFIGDAVMAVWGTDTAHEDDAERAVRAAFEVVESVAALGTNLGVGLSARAGVLTGEAAVTVGATAQGLVAGDLVNTASRLQSSAEPGTVLVGEATYQAASDAITFEPQGEISVKGRDEPVATWRALRVVGQRGGSGRPGRPEPPFAGRDEELRLIKELLHVTARERRARLVSITGIGGIGKSRLIWEFLKYVDGLSDDVFWHQGRCPAYGEGVTFWALGEMVRMRAGIAESDEPAQTRHKLEAMLDRYVVDADERRWTEPRLAHLLGLDDAPAGGREELFSAWRSLFERIAEHGPTVLVFEDLHWADVGLLDYIESILEWSRGSGILVVTLARPELLDRRPTWGAGQRNYTALHLDPLGEDPMTELVTGFVSGIVESDAQRVIGRAEGVPLYAVETIRMLADRGVLAVKGASYEVVRDIGALDVPSSLHALIAARLDVLPAADRELLRDATVLGVSFTVQSLATVRGEPVDAVEGRLRELVRKEFLVQDTDPRSPERGQYAFLQSLIREVAYGTLAKADRRRKHLAVARHLEQTGDDEVAAVIASHYIEALRATPEGASDADDLPATVRRWVSAAAQRALSLGSPDQALSYVEQVLDLTPPHERGPLLELAGDAAFRAGHVERAVGYFEDAITVFRNAGEVASAAKVTAMVAQPLGVLDRRPEAMRALETALAALADLPGDADDRVRATVLIRLSEGGRFGGESVRALEWLEQALTAAERIGADDLVIDALSERASNLFNIGRHREALVLARGAIELAGKADTRQALATALLNYSVMLVDESPRIAYEACLAAADAARRAGMRTPEHVAMANALEGAIDAGMFEQADTLMAELTTTELEAFLRSGVTFSAAMLAAFRGDDATAAARLAEMESRADLAGRMVQEQTWHLRVTSLVALLAGRVEAAYDEGMASIALEPMGMNAPNSLVGCLHAATWLRDAARLQDVAAGFDPLQGEWVEVMARSARAGLAAVEDRVDDAADGYRRVFETLTRMDLPLDHAWCVVDALAVLPRERVPEEDVVRARETLTELRAAPLLARLASS